MEESQSHGHTPIEYVPFLCSLFELGFGQLKASVACPTAERLLGHLRESGGWLNTSVGFLWALQNGSNIGRSHLLQKIQEMNKSNPKRPQEELNGQVLPAPIKRRLLI